MDIAALVEDLRLNHEYCTKEAILQAADALLAQQLVIEQMLDALLNLLGGVGECKTSLGQRVIDCPVGVAARETLRLQPSLEALREHDAAIREECAKICDELDNGRYANAADLCAERIRKGEM
jgi:hypothetical protein